MINPPLYGVLPQPDFVRGERPDPLVISLVGKWNLLPPAPRERTVPNSSLQEVMTVTEENSPDVYRLTDGAFDGKHTFFSRILRYLGGNVIDNYAVRFLHSFIVVEETKQFYTFDRT
jgi:hypothetical protein